VTLEFVEKMCDRGGGLELLLPVETALDDIPALAVTTEDAFRLSQGRPIVLLPRQVETLKARLAAPDGAGIASRTVLAMHGGVAVSICEMRAGQLSPTRVFNI
jgi:tRNA pseudouridine55 synthase